MKYAARAKHDGKVHIRFELRGDEIVLEVADDGVGIAAEDLNRVFEPSSPAPTGG